MSWLRALVPNIPQDRPISRQFTYTFQFISISPIPAACGAAFVEVHAGGKYLKGPAITSGGAVPHTRASTNEEWRWSPQQDSARVRVKLTSRGSRGWAPYSVAIKLFFRHDSGNHWSEFGKSIPVNVAAHAPAPHATGRHANRTTQPISLVWEVNHPRQMSVQVKVHLMCCADDTSPSPSASSSGPQISKAATHDLINTCGESSYRSSHDAGDTYTDASYPPLEPTLHSHRISAEEHSPGTSQGSGTPATSHLPSSILSVRTSAVAEPNGPSTESTPETPHSCSSMPPLEIASSAASACNTAAPSPKFASHTPQTHSTDPPIATTWAVPSPHRVNPSCPAEPVAFEPGAPVAAINPTGRSVWPLPINLASNPQSAQAIPVWHSVTPAQLEQAVAAALQQPYRPEVAGGLVVVGESEAVADYEGCDDICASDDMKLHRHVVAQPHPQRPGVGGVAKKLQALRSSSAVHGVAPSLRKTQPPRSASDNYPRSSITSHCDYTLALPKMDMHSSNRSAGAMSTTAGGSGVTHAQEETHPASTAVVVSANLGAGASTGGGQVAGREVLSSGDSDALMSFLEDDRIDDRHWEEVQTGDSVDLAAAACAYSTAPASLLSATAAFAGSSFAIGSRSAGYNDGASSRDNSRGQVVRLESPVRRYSRPASPISVTGTGGHDSMGRLPPSRRSPSYGGMRPAFLCSISHLNSPVEHLMPTDKDAGLLPMAHGWVGLGGPSSGSTSGVQPANSGGTLSARSSPGRQVIGKGDSKDLAATGCLPEGVETFPGASAVPAMSAPVLVAKGSDTGDGCVEETSEGVWWGSTVSNPCVTTAATRVLAAPAPAAQQVGTACGHAGLGQRPFLLSQPFTVHDTHDSYEWPSMAQLAESLPGSPSPTYAKGGSTEFKPATAEAARSTSPFALVMENNPPGSPASLRNMHASGQPERVRAGEVSPTQQQGREHSSEGSQGQASRRVPVQGRYPQRPVIAGGNRRASSSVPLPFSHGARARLLQLLSNANRPVHPFHTSGPIVSPSRRSGRVVTAQRASSTSHRCTSRQMLTHPFIGFLDMTGGGAHTHRARSAALLSRPPGVSDSCGPAELHVSGMDRLVRGTARMVARAAGHAMYMTQGGNSSEESVTVSPHSTVKHPSTMVEVFLAWITLVLVAPIALVLVLLSAVLGIPWPAA